MASPSILILSNHRERPKVAWRSNPRKRLPRRFAPRNGSFGFTLVEILISIGLLSLIAALGLFISFDFYRNFSFRSERSVIVSVLQKARSQSMDNIDEVRHGVHFAASPLKYIVFECDSGTPQCVDYSHADTSKNLTIDPGYSSTISSPSLPFDIMFDQLSGSSASQTITVSDNGKSYDITVNTEGRIDWQ